MRFPDPQSPLIFDRTTEEMEAFLLFCIVVAGKKASIQVKLLRDFLDSGDSSKSPFENIRDMNRKGELVDKLRLARLGQYTRLACCFRELINSRINLSTCTIEELENIHGIGAKTSRFFVTCNRQDVRHCVIDTHILKFMRQYLGMSVPTATPGNKKEYLRIESEWLDFVDTTGANSAELDLAVWKIYANRDDSEYRRLTGNSSNPRVALLA